MYEITFITREEKLDDVKKTIEKNEGKIISENFLGRRRFSYPIKKEDAGFYTSYIFEIDPVKLKEIHKMLGMKTEIIRYLITAWKQPKAEEIKPKKKDC